MGIVSMEAQGLSRQRPPATDKSRKPAFLALWQDVHLPSQTNPQKGNRPDQSNRRGKHHSNTGVKSTTRPRARSAARLRHCMCVLASPHPSICLTTHPGEWRGASRTMSSAYSSIVRATVRCASCRDAAAPSKKPAAKREAVRLPASVSTGTPAHRTVGVVLPAL